MMFVKISTVDLTNSSEKPSEKTKPSTHNKAWTESENRKLLELLDFYPALPNESTMQRARKISKALGTRTDTQVANRMSKVFALEAVRVLNLFDIH
jgi:hypothetical protein